MTHAGTALIDPSAVYKKITLEAGMRVADLGCGRTGHFVFTAARKVGDQGVVYAVEIVKNILESIRSRARSEGYSNVEAVWSDVEIVGGTPIPAGSLDVCFITNVLFMVKDKGAVLREASRLLQIEGVLVVIDWKKNLGMIGPGPGQMVSEEKVKDLAIEAGLQYIDHAVVGEYNYCLIFKKMDENL